MQKNSQLFLELARLENQVDDLAYFRSPTLPLPPRQREPSSPVELQLCCPLLDALTARVLSGALVVEMQSAAAVIREAKTGELRQLDQRCTAAAERLAVATQKVLAVEQSISTWMGKLEEADVSLKATVLKIEALEVELLVVRAEEERLSTALRQHSERTEKIKALRRQLDELTSEEAMLRNYQGRMTAELAKTTTPDPSVSATRPPLSALRVTATSPTLSTSSFTKAKPSFLPRFG